MIRGLVRIGGFAFGMTLSLNTLLEKEYNLIGERSSSSAIKQISGEGDGGAIFCASRQAYV